MKRRACSIFLLFVLLCGKLPSYVMADPENETNEMALLSTAVILMEGSTGEVIYSKNANEQLRPASITKIMTLLLIFEAISLKQLKLTDEIIVSAHAASMGGSQVFLEEGEKQVAETMIKCISIASANDASVAMAEHIAGSEEAFVKRMNQKAKDLGMKNTNFVNCYGLDTDNHYSSAMDVAIMSRELIVTYPDVSSYSTVWMDTFVHTTRKGETEFGLNNTNKLIRSYQGITGLKTGSTGLAKYCLSATARRDGMDLIAVIMAAPDTKTRFSEAAKLLNYGFSNCTIYTDAGDGLELPPIPVTGGLEKTVGLMADGKFHYVCMKGVNPADIKREVSLVNEAKAPLPAGTILGEIKYTLGGKKIGKLSLISVERIEEADFGDYLFRTLQKFLKQD